MTMFNRTELTELTQQYLNRCKLHNKAPTYQGLSLILNISGQTVGNVVKGSFNGKPYTNKPSVCRCIDNSDFDILRDLFNY